MGIWLIFSALCVWQSPVFILCIYFHCRIVFHYRNYSLKVKPLEDFTKLFSKNIRKGRDLVQRAWRIWITKGSLDGVNVTWESEREGMGNPRLLVASWLSKLRTMPFWPDAEGHSKTFYFKQESHVARFELLQDPLSWRAETGSAGSEMGGRRPAGDPSTVEVITDKAPKQRRPSDLPIKIFGHLDEWA